jgi:hypothetical protein
VVLAGELAGGRPVVRQSGLARNCGLDSAPCGTSFGAGGGSLRRLSFSNAKFYLTFAVWEVQPAMIRTPPLASGARRAFELDGARSDQGVFIEHRYNH